MDTNPFVCVCVCVFRQIMQGLTWKVYSQLVNSSVFLFSMELVLYSFHKKSTLDHTLSFLNPIHSLTLNLSSIRFNIILLSNT
jgi:hypothetical protein